MNNNYNDNDISVHTHGRDRLFIINVRSIQYLAHGSINT